DEVKPNTLSKSWRKFIDISEQKEVPNELIEEGKSSKEFPLLEMIRTLPGTDEVTESNIEEWITGDDKELEYTDTEIITLVDRKSSKESEESDEEVIEQRISHSNAVSALETALMYVEQQEGATPADIFMIKKWRDIAAKNRSTRLRQANLSSFFKIIDT
ncbi:Jerky protein-like protein-like protein, partial [Ooceraea biroi]